MNLRIVAYLLGWLFILFGGFQLTPMIVALLYGEPPLPYLASAAISAALGGGMVAVTRSEDRRIRPRDSFVIVSGTWAAITVFGALPYVLAVDASMVDAMFEAASGFTTTGSTIFPDVESMPRALLFWRAFTQWLGGMGIIVFTVAILPLLGIGGMQLFKAEVPGPTADKVRPRVAATARALWGVYVGLTALQVVLLMVAGMGLYDALLHSFTTLSTGGFSTRNASVGAYQSPLIEWIVTFFMFVGGINFVLHYRLLTQRTWSVYKDSELYTYAGTIVAASVFITVALLGTSVFHDGAFRAAVFQVVSLITTTGFATSDMELWPRSTQVLVVTMLVFGGMAGSTAGGVKGLRILLSVRSLQSTLWKLIHPHAVRPVKYGRQVVADSVLGGIWGFLTAYLLIAVGVALFLSAFGYDALTAFTASLTALGNVGPGLGEVGPYDNFSHFPPAAKLVLAGTMVLGRLEIFTVLVFLSPEFWRR